MDGSGDNFSGDDELDIVRKAMKLEAMTDYVTKGEQVKGEEEGAEN